MKKLFIPFAICLLVLTGCSTTKGVLKLTLSPTPLVMNVDPAIVTHLQVAEPKDSFAKQATKDGAIAQTLVYYIPDQGTKVIFMSVYEFPAAKFDQLKNPNQPPAYGEEVLRKDGKVFSVAGPKDSIFDPKSADGKRVAALYATIYKATTYSTP